MFLRTRARIYEYAGICLSHRQISRRNPTVRCGKALEHRLSVAQRSNNYDRWAEIAGPINRTDRSKRYATPAHELPGVVTVGPYRRDNFSVTAAFHHGNSTLLSTI